MVAGHGNEMETIAETAPGTTSICHLNRFPGSDVAELDPERQRRPESLLPACRRRPTYGTRTPDRPEPNPVMDSRFDRYCRPARFRRRRRVRLAVRISQSRRPTIR